MEGLFSFSWTRSDWLTVQGDFSLLPRVATEVLGSVPPYSHDELGILEASEDDLRVVVRAPER